MSDAVIVEFELLSSFSTSWSVVGPSLPWRRFYVFHWQILLQFLNILLTYLTQQSKPRWRNNKCLISDRFPLNGMWSWSNFGKPFFHFLRIGETSTSAFATWCTTDTFSWRRTSTQFLNARDDMYTLIITRLKHNFIHRKIPIQFFRLSQRFMHHVSSQYDSAETVWPGWGG